MALAEGFKLGPYEILAPLGAGGMGEVYKARDSRLDRTVALKVLPEGAADRTELRERMAREAKAVSSLNHPNICALYDVGHQDGTDYLVMEYLEGGTLSARIGEGPLPLAELLRCATQIAGALAVAHRQGLIHRDLKPGNIMMTPSGAKLLDFGLAKSFDSVAPATSLTAAATATSPLTAQGTIVGTWHYMAPELLEGGAADARSDIFAFGAVLYEMATGRRAFEGKTQASLIASILKEAPRPLAELAPMAPPSLQRLVATCLEKNPDGRRQTMNDVLLDLRWIAEGGSQAGLPAPVSRRRRQREMALAGITVASLATAAIFGILWQRASSRPLRAFTTSIATPPEIVVRHGDGFALSPDGTHMVLVAAEEDGHTGLWLRPLEGPGLERITGTENAEYPFWSPDGRHIGFFAQGKLKRIEARGGPTQVLAPAPAPRGGTWSADGTIVFSPNFRGPLMRMTAAEGEPVEITELDDERRETSHRWPWFLPDGRHVLFLSQTHEGGSVEDRSRIEVLDLEKLERRELFNANSSIQYAPSGQILFWSQGAVYAQPFDAGSLSLTGDIFPVADKVQYTVNEMAEFSISMEGTLALQGGERVTGLTSLVWYDRSGQRGEVITEEGTIFAPRLSRDGKRLAYSLQGDIWIRDLQRGAATRLSFDPGDEFDPVWSPDDRWIAYGATRGPSGAILRKLSSGLGDEEILYEAERQQVQMGDWAADGGSLVVGVQDPKEDWNLLSVPLEGGTPSSLVRTPFLDSDGKLSPDGKWLVYNSSESGQLGIYVVRLTEPGGRWQVSTDEAWDANWRGDGKEIFYVTNGDRLVSVTVSLGETFEAGLPEILFEAPLRPGAWYAYTPTSDGQRFIINAQPESGSTFPITLVQNWMATAGRN